MKILRVIASELYAASRIRTVQVTAVLVVLAAAVGSVMVWILPSLMSQVGEHDAESAAGMGIDLGIYSVDNPDFQLMSFDLSGSFQSGISMIVIVILALAVLTTGLSFRTGAVTWKVLLAGGRVTWAVGTLCALAFLVAAMGVLAAVVVAAVGYLGAAVQGGSVSIGVWVLLGVWLKGIASLVLLALMAAGVVIAVRSIGRALAVIAGIAVLNVVFSTIGTFAGWDAQYFSWLPMSASISAVGVSAQAALSPAPAWGIVVLWTVASVAWGLLRIRRYTL